jgi:hypothetical protein
MGAWKTFSKIFHVCLTLEKLVNKKWFSSKEKLKSFQMKVFSFSLLQNILSESLTKKKSKLK